MSNFASIAVLSKPTEQHPDWEFEMEGLKFEVHEGMVELNQEISDFEKFAGSLDSIFALIDNIASNNGRLDQSVYALVNQNNELAEALGIYTPFSFGSDDEQRQAGSELIMALEDDQNNSQKSDENEGDEKGFFAKAWEAIRNFFIKIGQAIKRIFTSSEAQEQASDNKNKSANKKLDSMTPDDVKKAFETAVKKQRAGIQLSADIAVDMVKSAASIASTVNSATSSIKDTVSFFDLLMSKGSYAKILEPAAAELKRFGYTFVDTQRFGEKIATPKKTGESEFRVEAKQRKDAIMSWATDPRKLIGPSGSLRTQIKDISKQFKSDAAVLEGLAKRFTDQNEIDNIIKQRGPSIGDRFKAFFNGKKDRIDMKAKCRLASEIGKDLANALSVLSGLFTECDSLMHATCDCVEGIILEQKIRETNKDYKELNQRRSVDQKNAEAYAANAKADEEAQKQGQDVYGDGF